MDTRSAVGLSATNKPGDALPLVGRGGPLRPLVAERNAPNKWQCVVHFLPRYVSNPPGSGSEFFH